MSCLPVFGASLFISFDRQHRPHRCLLLHYSCIEHAPWVVIPNICTPVQTAPHRLQLHVPLLTHLNLMHLMHGSQGCSDSCSFSLARLCIKQDLLWGCIHACFQVEPVHQDVVLLNLCTQCRRCSMFCMMGADQEARRRLGEGCQEIPAEAGRHRWLVPAIHCPQGPGNRLRHQSVELNLAQGPRPSWN